jgi:hypothetical protein
MIIKSQGKEKIKALKPKRPKIGKNKAPVALNIKTIKLPKYMEKTTIKARPDIQRIFLKTK